MCQQRFIRYSSMIPLGCCNVVLTELKQVVFLFKIVNFKKA
jgi:hypothetical protein